MSDALLAVRDLRKTFIWRHPLYRWRQQPLHAVDGVDLDVDRGTCLALVGESGCGKTTLGRTMIRLLEPDAGTICFAGDDLCALGPAALRRSRRALQMVFQDPGGALDPRMRIGDLIAEPLEVHRTVERSAIAKRVVDLLSTVGLVESSRERYPHELSGGQRQRVGIARALATKPRLLVLDEPVSALDVSVQARILQLLLALRERFDLTMVFIGHDLAVVEQIADRVAVLYLGQIVENAPRARLFDRPQHPYTATLLAAVPTSKPAAQSRRRLLRGELPSPLAPPPGCRFHPRCPRAEARCREEAPTLRQVAPEHLVACHFPGQADVHETP